jgi:ribose-phosphate pyrophosphokinase
LALPLIFGARTAREFGARSVGLIAPYLAYMRQDARFQPGEAISSIHFGAFLSAAVDWVVTVDPHLHRLADLSALFSIPAVHVSAMPLVADWIRAEIRAPALIGPDSESAQWVRPLADRIGAPIVVLEKQRHGDRDVDVSMPDRGILEGRTPVLVDDIVSSGRTFIETLGRLRALGLPPAVCIAVHGIFADGADETLKRAGAARVVTCNTIAHPTNAIDVAPVLEPAIRALLDARKGTP